GVKVKKSDLADANTQTLQDRIKNDPTFLRKVLVWGARLRGSRPYWTQRCSELLDMVSQMGTPTVFFTLSAADYHWPDLFRLLAPNVDISSLSEQLRKELMHIVAFFFQKR